MELDEEAKQDEKSSKKKKKRESVKDTKTSDSLQEALINKAVSNAMKVDPSKIEIDITKTATKTADFVSKINFK